MNIYILFCYFILIAEGHDSKEDASACIELMIWKINEDLKLSKNLNELKLNHNSGGQQSSIAPVIKQQQPLQSHPSTVKCPVTSHHSLINNNRSTTTVTTKSSVFKLTNKPTTSSSSSNNSLNQATVDAAKRVSAMQASFVKTSTTLFNTKQAK
jgi:hypothetical protein